MLRAAGAGAVAVTRGAQGVLFCSAEGTLSVAAPGSRLCDTTGAGDVFCGVLVGGLLAASPACGARRRDGGRVAGRHPRGSARLLPDGGRDRRPVPAHNPSESR